MFQMVTESSQTFSAGSYAGNMCGGPYFYGTLPAVSGILLDSCGTPRVFEVPLGISSAPGENVAALGLSDGELKMMLW